MRWSKQFQAVYHPAVGELRVECIHFRISNVLQGPIWRSASCLPSCWLSNPSCSPEFSNLWLAAFCPCLWTLTSTFGQLQVFEISWWKRKESRHHRWFYRWFGQGLRIQRLMNRFWEVPRELASFLVDHASWLGYPLSFQHSKIRRYLPKQLPQTQPNCSFSFVYLGATPCYFSKESCSPWDSLKCLFLAFPSSLSYWSIPREIPSLAPDHRDRRSRIQQVSWPLAHFSWISLN